MSDLYTKLVSNVIFPVQERLKHHNTVAVRQQMEQSQWWPRKRIEELPPPLAVQMNGFFDLARFEFGHAARSPGLAVEF